MNNKALGLLVALLLTSCATLPTGIPNSLVGVWVRDPAASKLPVEPGESCNGGGIEFTADGHQIITSGELTLRRRVKVEQTDHGYLITYGEILESNERDNCQGIPWEDYRAGSVGTFYVERRGGKLHFYPEQTPGKYFDSYRRKPEI